MADDESSNRPDPQPATDRVIWTLLGGAFGAFIVYFIKEAKITLLPVEMKYEDLAVVLLTAVGVIVTVFGAILAILAFWGFSQLKEEAAKGAIKAAKLQVDQSIRDEISSPEFERRVRRRVDEIALGNVAKDRELDTDPENDGDENA